LKRKYKNKNKNKPKMMKNKNNSKMMIHQKVLFSVSGILNKTTNFL